MGEQILPIRMTLDRSGAERAAAAFRANMSQLNRAMSGDSAAASAAETQKLRAEYDARKQAKAAAVEAELRTVRRAAEEEGISIRSLKQARKQATDEGADGFRKMADTSAEGSQKMALGMGAVAAGLLGALNMAKQLGAAFDEVGRKQKAMADKFSGEQDSLRELAAVKGKTADAAFTVEQHHFAKDTAMRFGEAVEFRGNFANSAEQYRDKTIDSRELDEYERMSATNAARTGASSTAAAAFAGSFLTRDLTKFGAGAAEEAFRRQHQVGSIYDAGEGTATQNFTAFGTLKKEFESDPTLSGAFKSDTELATIGSIANAAGPDRQREQVAALTRNLRDGKNEKLAALYGQAKVGADEGIQGTIEKIAPFLVDQAKASGKGLDQVIGELIPDAQAREALSIQVSQGVLGGGYAQRAEVAARSGKAGAGEQALEDFKSSEVGIERTADADAELAKAERSAKDKDAQILRKQAVTNLIRSGDIDSDSGAVKDFMAGKSFGLLGQDEQNRIDAEALRMVIARGPAGTEKGGVTFEDRGAVTPQQRTKELGRVAGQVRDSGLDPLKSFRGEKEILDDARLTPAERVNKFLAEQKNPAKARAAAEAEWGGGGGAESEWGGKPVGDNQQVNVLKEIRDGISQLNKNVAPAAPRPLVPANPAIRR